MRRPFPSRFDLALLAATIVAVCVLIFQSLPGNVTDPPEVRSPVAPKLTAILITDLPAAKSGIDRLAELKRLAALERAAPASDPFNIGRPQFDQLAVPLVRDIGLLPYLAEVSELDVHDDLLRRAIEIGVQWTIRVEGFETFTEILESGDLDAELFEKVASFGARSDLGHRDLLVGTDVGKRLDWLERYANNPRTLGDSVMQWVRWDHAAAATWLGAREPAPKYDQAAVWVVDALAPIDAVAASKWLDFITEPSVREGIEGYVTKSAAEQARDEKSAVDRSGS